MPTYLPIIGTLLGTLIGSLGTFLVQRGAFERERRSRLFQARRTACLTLLSAFHEHYIRLVAAAESDEEDREKCLRKIDSRVGQEALDSFRLVMDGEPVTLAREIWKHLRGTPFATGKDDHINGWKNGYWVKRDAFFKAMSQFLAAEI